MLTFPACRLMLDGETERSGFKQEYETFHFLVYQIVLHETSPKIGLVQFGKTGWRQRTTWRRKT
ncbi:hypothetical protein CPT32_04060 [Rhizobium sophoriradicis]|nr:hypothetical protein CPT32_04060 [Rhizobium sophoriradicis]